MTKADWIGVDWGTSRVRAWAMDTGGRPLASAESDDGMGDLARDDFEPALLSLIEPWLTGRLRIVICGMAGAREGWAEAPYRAVPCPPIASGIAPEVDDARLDATIVPGLSQADPPDVMRGEETQIAGLMARRPGFDGIVCLPGTHTKWVEISAGEVVSFRTFMTGEIFALLSRRSILRHVVGEAWDDPPFHAALDDAISSPQMLGARLFGIRAETLIANAPEEMPQARLLGLLIGLELAGARPYWLGQRVVILGAETLAQRYRSALARQGVAAELVDVEEVTCAGLAAARTAGMERT